MATRGNDCLSLKVSISWGSAHATTRRPRSPRRTVADSQRPIAVKPGCVSGARTSGRSPFDGTLIPDKAAGGAVIWKCRQPHRRGNTLLNRPGSREPAHVRAHPAWIDGVGEHAAAVVRV